VELHRRREEVTMSAVVEPVVLVFM
jgi:hypothetical protein